MSPKRAVAALVATGVALTLSIAALVVKPDEGECYRAVDRMVIASALHNVTFTDDQARERLWWPCRFTTKATVEGFAVESLEKHQELFWLKTLDGE